MNIFTEFSLYLGIDTGGEELAIVADCSEVTEVHATVWKIAGADLASMNGRLAGDCVAELEAGVQGLKVGAEAFYHLVKTDEGRQQVQYAVVGLSGYAKAFRQHPKATVVVCR